MNLSIHFTLEEMMASATAKRLGIDNTPPQDVLDNLNRLTQELEKVRALTGLPLNVQSGYRCPELNQAVGGVPNSYHTYGCAADILPPDGTTFPDFEAMIVKAEYIDFDLLLEEQAKDGAHWIHFQIAKPLASARRLVEKATLDKEGGAITSVTRLTVS